MRIASVETVVIQPVAGFTGQLRESRSGLLCPAESSHDGQSELSLLARSTMSSKPIA